MTPWGPETDHNNADTNDNSLRVKASQNDDSYRYKHKQSYSTYGDHGIGADTNYLTLNRAAPKFGGTSNNFLSVSPNMVGLISPAKNGEADGGEGDRGSQELEDEGKNNADVVIEMMDDEKEGEVKVVVEG